VTEYFVKDYRDYLLSELQKRQQRRALYSKRALARDLDVSPSTITGFLKGEIRFTRKRIQTIGKKLKLNPDQIEHWTDLTDLKFSRDISHKKIVKLRVSNRVESESNFISLNRFKFISEWQHAAYLELLNLNSKKYSDIKCASKALKTSPRFLNQIIKRLLVLKLIEQTSLDHYVVVKNIKTGDTTSSSAIREFHSGLLKKAQLSLEHQDMTERSNSSIIFRISKEKIPKIQSDFKEMGWNLIEKYFDKNDPKNDSVYCLSMQLFNLLK
jgi:uncharacterized protein (TIGR02147 family)